MGIRSHSGKQSGAPRDRSGAFVRQFERILAGVRPPPTEQSGTFLQAVGRIARAFWCIPANVQTHSSGRSSASQRTFGRILTRIRDHHANVLVHPGEASWRSRADVQARSANVLLVHSGEHSAAPKQPFCSIRASIQVHRANVRAHPCERPLRSRVNIRAHSGEQSVASYVH